MTDYLFEVIVGTYEEYVLGYKFNPRENGEVELIQSFAVHSHRGSVRSVASKGKFLVSGGADESINIYDMVQRREAGTIIGEHSGTITCLSFTPDGSHLVVTSDDGSIKYFRVGSWMIEKDFKTAHKGTGVSSISIHPSGKMALSVGRDHTLRTWNLVKGRPAYTTNLASRCKNLEWVMWSPGGNYYAVNMDSKLEIFSVKTAGVVYTWNFESKVTYFTFTQNAEDKGEILIGESSGKLHCHSLETGKELWHIDGTERIKCLQTIMDYLVMGTSTGKMTVYKFRNTRTKPSLVASVDTGCRIICLTVLDLTRSTTELQNVQRWLLKKRLSRYIPEISTVVGLKVKKEKDEVKEDSKVTEKVVTKKRKLDFIVEDSKVQKTNSKQNAVKCTVKSQKWKVVDST